MKRTRPGDGEPASPMATQGGGMTMAAVMAGHAAKIDPDASRPSFDRLLTVPEVAELLRFTIKGVYTLVEARRIPFIRISNRLRFCQTDVLAWLRENRVPSVERNR